MMVAKRVSLSCLPFSPASCSGKGSYFFGLPFLSSSKKHTSGPTVPDFSATPTMAHLPSTRIHSPMDDLRL